MAQLKASTLIETLVSLVIISITFFIAMSIVQALAQTNKNREKLKACLLASTIYEEVKTQGVFNSMSEEQGKYHIERVVVSYRDDKQLYELNVIIFDKYTREQILSMLDFCCGV